MKLIRVLGVAAVLIGFLFGVTASAEASEPWGACGVRAKADKLVTNFGRRYAAPPGGAVPSGTTTFKCGTNGWGYRHLLYQGHDDEFRDMAANTNQNWRTVADKGITKALNDPHTVTYNKKKETYCYSASVNLYNGDRFVRSQIVVVVIGEGNWNVVTAYPSYKGHCQSSWT